MEEIARLLQEGIQAVKAGRREEAKALLMQVLAVDEENERAWLWLSGAMETDEERRICLENVLTLNPNNELAQKGLARLKPKLVPEEEMELPASFTEAADDEPSEAILPPSFMAQATQMQRPAPKEEEGWWVEQKFGETETAVKKYDDVWASREDICAYCAAPIDRIQSRCPQCGRQLIAKTFLHPIPSNNHNRLLVWTVVNFLLYTGLTAYDLLFSSQYCLNISRDALLAVTGSALILPQIVIIGGIYQRQTWAYWLLVVRAILEMGWLINIGLELASLLGQIRLLGFIVALREVYCFGFVVILFTILLIVGILNIYFIYMGSEDFKRVPVRRLATVNDRLKDPNILDRIAQRLAKEGQWASAVLHWQRAVGRASGHAPYLTRLGHAYAELGFYERSMDALNAALAAARNSQVREAVEQEMIRTRRLRQAKEEPRAMSTHTS